MVESVTSEIDWPFQIPDPDRQFDFGESSTKLLKCIKNLQNEFSPNETD